MNVIIENQYLPPICLFSFLYREKHLVFEQCENFQKRSFRNRCIVAGSEGPISLTIPLKKGRDQKLPIREIEIDYKTNWQEHHWRTIQSCYNRSPWFEHYRDELKDLFQTRIDLLFDWDLELFKWAVRQLQMKVEISYTHAFHINYSDAEFIDLRNKILPKNYQVWETKKYQQVFSDRVGFLQNLSVLDLIFCTGKSSKEFL